MPRYPFYSSDYAGDTNDLSYYGGRFDFVFPRVFPAPNRLPLWNKYAYPDHFYGPTDPAADSYQQTESDGGMSAEEIAALSDGIGYPKEQPSPLWPLDAADQLGSTVLGFNLAALVDDGTLEQYSGLPRNVISAGDGDLNAGLRALLSLFQGTLTLTTETPRVYWWPYYDAYNSGTNTLTLHVGQVTAYEYKWTDPGVVESFDPDVITGTLAGEEPYSNYKATTPAYWSGSTTSPFYLGDPTSTTGVLPLTHTNGEMVEVVNRFHRWKNSRFFLVAHPSDVPPLTGDAEKDQRTHDAMIEQIGTIHLWDYEINTRKPKRRFSHRWIKKD